MLFGLFKRTKIEDWEIQLLETVIKKLPSEYSHLLFQIKDGLLRNIFLNASDIPGYNSFGIHSDIYEKYFIKNERNYKLTEIKVFDKLRSIYLIYSIFVSNGVINGYSLDGKKKYKVDLNKIDISKFKKEFFDELDFNRIKNILDDEEKKFINPSNVYSVIVGNKEYFHIKDLDDGDFIGIDENKDIYKITHDPMEVIKIEKKLKEIINDYRSNF
jgi:hypothetical protein